MDGAGDTQLDIAVLTTGSPGQLYAIRANGTIRPGFPVSAVSYLCPPERVEGIRAQLARILGQLDRDRRTRSARPEPLPRIEVLPLPEVPGATYDGRW